MSEIPGRKLSMEDKYSEIIWRLNFLDYKRNFLQVTVYLIVKTGRHKPVVFITDILSSYLFFLPTTTLGALWNTKKFTKN